MKLSISSDSERFIEASLESGRYADSGVLLDEAIRLLKRRDDSIQAVDAGVDQLNRGETVDGELLFDRLTSKLQSKATPGTD